MRPRKNYPHGDGFTNLNVRIPTDLYGPLKLHAMNRGIPIPDLVAQALRLLAADIESKR